MSADDERKRLAGVLRAVASGHGPFALQDLADAADILDPPAPPEGTVRVRVAVATTSEDGWMAYGAAWSDDDSSSDYVKDNTPRDSRLTWVTADIPLPAPPAEVEGRTE